MIEDVGTKVTASEASGNFLKEKEDRFPWFFGKSQGFIMIGEPFDGADFNGLVSVLSWAAGPRCEGYDSGGNKCFHLIVSSQNGFLFREVFSKSHFFCFRVIYTKRGIKRFGSVQTDTAQNIVGFLICRTLSGKFYWVDRFFAPDLDLLRLHQTTLQYLYYGRKFLLLRALF